MKIKTCRNYTLRVTEGQKVQTLRTHSIRKFLREIRTIKWENSVRRVYLRVSCGKKKDCFGNFLTFFNDGTYKNREDFKLALEGFLEED